MLDEILVEDQAKIFELQKGWIDLVQGNTILVIGKSRNYI